MSLFQKLFGRGDAEEPSPGSEPGPPPPPSEKKSDGGGMLRVRDASGREIRMSRSSWIDQVLMREIQETWDRPDGLASILAKVVGEGFAADVEEAAEHLQRTDPRPARGTSLLAIVYLRTGRPEEARKLLSDYLAERGDDPAIWANLARAMEDLGREDEMLDALWRSLQLDPNERSVVEWYGLFHDQRDGEKGGVEALRRVAQVPGSWRAQVLLARHELLQGRLEAALGLYRVALSNAGTPPPVDLMVDMSGALVRCGHAHEVLGLAASRFDVNLHGLAVGDNLLKACIESRQIELARRLLRFLQSAGQPDWQERLDYWENELARAYASGGTPVTEGELNATLLYFPGPLWLSPDTPMVSAFPVAGTKAPRIVFSGCSFEGARDGLGSVVQPSEAAGRLSRALPLWFSERFFAGGGVRPAAQIPWVLAGGGFVLSNRPTPDASVVEQGRLVTKGEEPEFVVNSHLVGQGGKWLLVLRLIRMADARRLSEMRYAFAEGGLHTVSAKVLHDLGQAIAKASGFRVGELDPVLEGVALDEYLFCLEQCLVACCSRIEGTRPDFLGNPGAILGSMLELCRRNPRHVPSRMMLWRTLRALEDSAPGLMAKARPQVESLMAEHPLPGALQGMLEEAIGGLIKGA